MSDTCYIFFRPGKATLESAESSLMEYGLTVDRADGRLVVHLPGSLNVGDSSDEEKLSIMRATVLTLIEELAKESLQEMEMLA